MSYDRLSVPGWDFGVSQEIGLVMDPSTIERILARFQESFGIAY